MYTFNELERLAVEEELYTRVSENSFGLSVAVFIILVVISIIFYKDGNEVFFFEWLSVIALLLVLFNRDAHLYKRDESTLSLEEHIERFKIFTLSTVIVLSAGIVYLASTEEPFFQAFFGMIIVGLAAGGVMALSFYQKIVRAYLVILIFPFSILMFTYHEYVHTSIGFLLILSFIMLIIFSKKFHETVIDLITSRNDKYIQAHYDFTTGLLNREALYNRLKQEMAYIKRDNLGIKD